MASDNQVEKSNRIIYYVSIPAGIAFLVGYGMSQSKNEKLSGPGALLGLIGLSVLIASLLIAFVKKGQASRSF